ncbi:MULTISPECIES: LssY C-terminal domain-containing protein [unclassified Rothia (in: high G+C Gram-positive bacteria)]|uniref:LssY C-terminal domain-containing protein n=1 Tax=unclassified Rothia (in: high G+C Gram-positive bacteria) TaxID=2689056 RepID=UPI00195A3B20|nr:MULTISPECIES: LssY C-terminal domain-containing protein [unclassified Rothia (in: high G+C Gram-positive bacteria)]MBM7050868.1 LssY C-terminal domain-containing protein [Rothia sp. ZJ1223]QRZ62391.1 LssY C-terminal domain-containing protein [Rothia sp. ZJ932]
MAERFDIRQVEGYPVYRGNTHQPLKPGHKHLPGVGRRRALNGWIDKSYFAFAGLASMWLAVITLYTALNNSSWSSIPLILLLWGVAAYMILPRLHRILTALYVPAYFIGRTQTGDGLLGDPVNLGVRGESVDVHRAMRRAGWLRAEPVTLASSWRIIINTLRRQPYPTAPVSPLYLFDRKEDFAYQQEVDGNPSKRHHVRFWKTPPGWKLPGGVEVDWVAAATFDRAVGLSLFTLQVTHKIDADTDKERDYLVETVLFANEEAYHDVIVDFSAGYHSRNGGGDNIITDGNLPILELDDVITEEMKIPDLSPESRYSHHRKPWELVEQIPLSTVFASAFVIIGAALQFANGILRLLQVLTEVGVRSYEDLLDVLTHTVHPDELFNGSLVAGLVALSAIHILLAAGVLRGRQRSRKVILALLAVSIALTSILLLREAFNYNGIFTVYVLLASQVFAMIEYTSDGAVNYTHNVTRSRRLERLKVRATKLVHKPR